MKKEEVKIRAMIFCNCCDNYYIVCECLSDPKG
jgi:hypothetical protein